MRNLIIVLTAALLVSACGKQESSVGAGGGVVDSPTTPQLVGGVAIPSCTPTLANVQFLIACPDNTGTIPETLLKSGQNVFLVTKTGNNVTYTFKPPGNYTSQDGRSCNYTVLGDGSIQ